MRVALIESTPDAKVYPIALLKIGAMLKQMGHECELFRNNLPRAGDFDEIWVTTVFTFDIKHALGIVREAKLRAPVVQVGGISASLLPERFESEGVDVHRGLLLPAEEVIPDYSLLKQAPKYSICYASRGCVRACKFCMVSKLEPVFKEILHWESWLHPETTEVHFFDNNWLAKSEISWEADVTKLHEFVASKRITSIEFRQGLDARLMTEDRAKRIQGLPIRPIRFAFDGMHEDGPFQKAIEICAAHGFREFSSYVLYNYKDKPQDFYYRMKTCALLSRRLKIICKSFPTRFQPIEEADEGRKYIGKHWTKKTRGTFQAIRSVGFPGGVVSPSSVGEFEYWFGKDEDEFVRLLNYPRIKELLAGKVGRLRTMRFEGKRPWPGPLNDHRPLEGTGARRCEPGIGMDADDGSVMVDESTSSP